MHFFLYEWITGGGLVEETGPLPPSLLLEGGAMLSAMAADLVAISGARVSLLKDMRLDDLVLPGCDVVEVQSKAEHDEEFGRLAVAADYSLVIAPEFDRVLKRCHRLVTTSGGTLLGCEDALVAVTTNKHRTAARLFESGVPVPEGVLIEPETEKLPDDFQYPAVLKPIDGAGSQNMVLISKASDEPPPHAWPRRLERFCPGIAASVSFLCGPRQRVALPPCRQHLSVDGNFTYEGGSRLMEQELARRATSLATRALEALPPAAGFVGIDLILGKSPDGSEDYVIEVNPRLTTSYVGLRAMTDSNLASALLDIALGKDVAIEFNDSGIEFFADGTVCYQSPS